MVHCFVETISFEVHASLELLLLSHSEAYEWVLAGAHHLNRSLHENVMACMWVRYGSHYKSMQT